MEVHCDWFVLGQLGLVVMRQHHDCVQILTTQSITVHKNRSHQPPSQDSVFPIRIILLRLHSDQSHLVYCTVYEKKREHYQFGYRRLAAALTAKLTDKLKICGNHYYKRTERRQLRPRHACQGMEHVMGWVSSVERIGYRLRPNPHPRPDPKPKPEHPRPIPSVSALLCL